MASDLAAFGGRLKKLRLSLGMSQEEVVGDRQLRVLSQIESGKREPSNEALMFLADRLGAGVEEL